MKIIFLDIDGPMIPMRSYIWDVHASLHQQLDEMCVRVLHHIIDLTGAKIVFNTTHNLKLVKDTYSPGLLNQFNAAGFREHIHEDIYTAYPEINRHAAILDWLSRNPTETWIALDDEKIPDPRAFLVDFRHGIGYDEVQHAREHLLGEKPKLVLM